MNNLLSLHDSLGAKVSEELDGTLTILARSCAIATQYVAHERMDAYYIGGASSILHT